MPGKIYTFGEFTVDPLHRRLKRGDGEVLALTPRAFDTLLFLLQRSGEVVSKTELMHVVWPGRIVEENNLSQSISILRRALNDDPKGKRYILTVPGHGYRFVTEVQTRDADDEAPDAPRVDPPVVPEALEPGAPLAAEPKVSTQRRREALSLRVIVGTTLTVLGLLGATLLYLRLVSTSSPHAATWQPPVDAQSIAVLPFDSLSADPDSAYLAEGIRDEILTHLAKIGALKVISRGSTDKYPAAPANIGEIAQQLGVANILEGSVQKAGGKIRINLRLIKAGNGSHLWAETYDRTLTDIFVVESEVAEAVASSMQATLTQNEQRSLAQKPTNVPEAYDAYLRGLALWHRPGLEQTDVLNAAQSLETAVKLDPEFSTAWALLAQVDSFAYYISYDASPARGAQAADALAHAVKLQPDSLETRIAQGNYLNWVRRDYDGARRLLEQVQAQMPNNIDALLALAKIARREGRWQDSVGFYDEALIRDPRDVAILIDAGITHLALRDFSSALRLADRVTDVVPTDAGGIELKVAVYQGLGQLDQSQALLGQLHIESGDIATVMLMGRQAALRHRYADQITQLQGLLANTPPWAMMKRGYYHLSLGDMQRLSGDASAAHESYSHARNEFETIMRMQPDNAGVINWLALVYAGLGDRDSALAHAQRAVALLPASSDAMIGPLYQETLVRIEARFGDTDKAVSGLRDLLALPYIRAITSVQLQHDPDWDALRNDPGFQQLLKDQALPAAGS